MHNQRGAILGILIPAALVSAIAAYAVLQASVSEARHAAFVRGHVEARYLSEAAIVIARQKLWDEATTPYPAGCTGGNIGTDMVAVESVDTNGDGTGDVNINVTVTNCGPGNRHAVSAQAIY